MLNVIFSIGGWALFCAVIFFGAEMVEWERKFFSRGDVAFGRLE